MKQLRAGLVLAGWAIGLSVVIIAFGHGRGLFTGPPVGRPNELGHWLATRSPDMAFFAILRPAVVVLACYLLGSTVLSSLARITRSAALVRATDVFILP